MSIQGLFNIGMSGVNASQMALTVTSNNIDNVNTPNYCRQEIVLDPSTPTSGGAVGSVGTGVTAESIKRDYDALLNNQLLGQTSASGASTTLSDGLSQAEQVFNDSAGAGLSGPLNDFFTAWNNVANNPEDTSQRTVLMQDANTLIGSAQQMQSSLENIVKTTNSDLASTATQINSLTKDIADLNTRIQNAGGPTNASNLLDQRDQKLSQLGTLVNFTTVEGNKGQFTVIVGRQNLVDGSTSRQITAQADTNQDVHYYVNGSQMDQYIQKGSVGGDIALRDSIRNNAINPLRSLMASLVDNVNQQSRQGYGLDGVTGRDFFTPSSSAADPADIISNMGLAITDPSQVAASLPTSSIGATFSNFVTDPGETVNFNVDNIPLSFTGTGTAAGDATAFYNALQAEQTNNGTLQGYTFADDGKGSVTVTLANPASGPVPITINGWSGSDSTTDTSVTVTPTSGTLSDTTVLNDDSTGSSTVSTSLSLTLDKGIPGNNTNALAMASLQNTRLTINGQNSTILQYYNSAVSKIGSAAAASNNATSFDKTLLSDLQNRRDQVSAVSIDEEAMNMEVFQRAYQASARIITVADQLMQTVIAIGSGT